MSLFDKQKREPKKKQDEFYLDLVDTETFRKLKNSVELLKDEVETVKEVLKDVLEKTDILEKELNRKDVEISELVAEITTLKATTKDMGGSVIQQENEIKKSTGTNRSC